MSFPIPAELRDTGFYYSTALTEIMHQLKDMAVDMAAHGFEEEAATLKTTIDDLVWQYEGLINKELTAQWPNGSRRPLLTPVKTSR